MRMLLQISNHNFRANHQVPDYIWNLLKAMPENSHPMTMLTTAIQSMQVDSLFVQKI